MAAQLGLPPGYRFVPTDEEVVRLHLLPCIQGQPQPRNDIIVDDPLSAPPWALLEKHGRKQEVFFAAGQAMNAKGNRQKRTCKGHGTWEGQGKRKQEVFFAAGQAMNAKGNRQKRTCKGHGTWEGQGKKKRHEEGKEKESKKRMRVSVCGSSKEIEWEKYALNFQENGVKGSTGWVMHEYSITSPPEFAQSPMRVYCIRHSGHGKNAKKYSRDAQDWGSDDEDEEEVDDASAEEDPALFIGEYPLTPQAEYVTSLPVVAADVVNANPAADGAGAVAGNDQGLPMLVEDDDCFAFMNSLSDLVPGFELSQ